MSTAEALAFEDDPSIDVEAVRRGGLAMFVQLAWHIVESSPLVWGWHLEEVCKHLEAVSRGECKRLIINIPPGMSKSLITSVFWPAWDWLQKPQRKWMFSTFDADLARRDSLRCRELLTSDWFTARWGDKVRVYDGEEKQRTMGVYYTTAQGMRFSTSVGGKATGWHSHIQVVDDPTKPQDVKDGGDKAREALLRTWAWWTGTMSSRKADPQDFARVIIMQRLHEDDLAGQCAASGEWTLLCLPMRFEKARACVTPWGGDRRTEEGELLNPARFDEQSVAETEREMGSQVAAAQLQQRPAPAKGLIFERSWLAKEWTALPAHGRWIMSWDCAFKDLATSDYVVGQVWCQKGAEMYLVHQVRAHMTFSETCQAIRDMVVDYKQVGAILVENKANGTAIIDALTKEISGIIGIEPDGGKVARAYAAQPMFEAGNVFVPTLASAPWIAAWREEMATFPMGRYDDVVDSSTQAVNYFHNNPDGSVEDIKGGSLPSRYTRRAGL